MTPGLKARLGCWLHERWKAELVLRAAPLARVFGWTWRDLGNRHDHIGKGESVARRCLAEGSSALTVARVFPRVGSRLLEACTAESPISFEARDRPGDQPRIAVVLPVGGADRIEHFRWVLRAFLAQTVDGLEVVVAEHGDGSYEPAVGDSVRYVHLPRGEEEGFNKSRALNRGVEAASAPLVLLHDADVVPPADYVEGVVRRLDAGWEAVRPIRFAFHLDRDDSRAFLEHRGRRLPRAVETVIQNNDGLSTALRRDIYFEIGGHDERFEGWGGEDTEFLQRLRTRRLYPGAYSFGVHLWHPPAPKLVSGDRNRAVLAQITAEDPRRRIQRLVSAARS